MGRRRRRGMGRRRMVNPSKGLNTLSFLICFQVLLPLLGLLFNEVYSQKPSNSPPPKLVH
jgi:hypothetical protein